MLYQTGSLFLKFCFLRKGGRFRRWNSRTATAARGRHGAAGDGAGLARGWLGVGSSWHGEQALTWHARQVICIELQHKLTGWICKALTYKFSSWILYNRHEIQCECIGMIEHWSEFLDDQFNENLCKSHAVAYCCHDWHETYMHWSILKHKWQ